MDHEPKIKDSMDSIESAEFILNQFDISLTQQSVYNIENEFKKTTYSITSYIFFSILILGLLFSFSGIYYILKSALQSQIYNISIYDDFNKDIEGIYFGINDIKSRIDDLEFSNSILKQIIKKTHNRDDIFKSFIKKAKKNYSGYNLEEKLTIIKNIEKLSYIENKEQITPIINQNNKIIENLTKSLEKYKENILIIQNDLAEDEKNESTNK